MQKNKNKNNESNSRSKPYCIDEESQVVKAMSCQVIRHHIKPNIFNKEYKLGNDCGRAS